MVFCPLDVVCKSLFTNHRTESSFFFPLSNKLINWLINSLINLGPAQSTFVCPTDAYSYYADTDRKSQQQRLNVSRNIIDAHTHPYTNACIYTYICIYIYVHPCSEYVADVYVDIEKTSVYVYTCTCTGAQNTCSKVHATLIAKKRHIYVYKHTYAHAYISA